MLRQQGRIDEAVVLVAQAMALYAQRPIGLNVQAEFLNRCGRFADACAVADQAIAADPESSSAWFNRGVALAGMGRVDEAIAAYEAALERDGNLAGALNNLGSIHSRRGALDAALDFHRRAAAASPGEVLYWSNLAAALTAKGDWPNALDALRQGIALRREDIGLWRRYVDLIGKIANLDITGQLVDELGYCLSVPELSTDRVREIGCRIFMLQIVVKTLLDAHDGERFANFLAVFSDTDLRQRRDELSHGLFCRLLSGRRIASPGLETFLATLRRHLLDFAVNGNLGLVLWRNGLDFLAALAHQCFLTEYVYWVAPQEKTQLETLVDMVAEVCRRGQTPDPAVVALLACYRPLHKFKFVRTLASLPLLAGNPLLAGLFRVQVEEPEEEARLRKQIRALTPIHDEISQAVRRQYEENPYPRWGVPRVFHALSVADYVRGLTPLNHDAVPDLPEAPEILIAGCGSGQQPIEVAISMPTARITAIDLSLTTMAYAMRKARELGVTNIEFGQADLLEIGAWTQRFDMIMCSGVLHHLAVPEQGLDVLLSLLKPGGLLKLAVYSDTARQSIVAARDFIAQNGYSTSEDGIRQCRHDIWTLPDADPVRGVVRWGDYYATSTCRDLLFHVQEHRYTIPKLKASLEERNLQFLGFLYSDVDLFNAYLARFPDDVRAVNLDNWAVFEAENPLIFMNMYQFTAKRG